MSLVHTALGPGRIVGEDVVRGRKQFLVEGAAFKTWIAESDAQIDYRTAGFDAPATNVGDHAPTNEGLEIHEDNSVDLPYNPRPQFPVEQFKGEQNIQPIHRIDADDRTDDADSRSFKDAPHQYPRPSKDLFAKPAYRMAALSEEALAEIPEVEDVVKDPHYVGDWPNYPMHGEEYVPRLHHRDLPMVEPEEPVVYPRGTSMEDNLEHGTLNDHWRHYHDRMDFRHDKGRFPHRPIPETRINAPEVDKYVLEHGTPIAASRHEAAGYVPYKPPTWGSNTLDGLKMPHRTKPLEDEVLDAGHSSQLSQFGVGRSAGLSDKFIDITADVDHFNDPVQRFRDDPVREIHRVGHILSASYDPRIAEYAALVESDPQLRQAAWDDVRNKAVRLRREGKVEIHDAGPDRIYATVKGDNGDYDVMIATGGFGGFGTGPSITHYSCSCPWGVHAFQRQKLHIGRLCSHAYSAYLEMQSRQMKEVSKKQAGVVDNFKEWVKEENNDHADLPSLSDFIARPQDKEDTHRTKKDPYTEEEVQDLYDYVEHNKSHAPERNYNEKSYTFDPQEVYKHGAFDYGDDAPVGHQDRDIHTPSAPGASHYADVLRLRPHSLTPDFQFVDDDGDGEEWTDVEEDDRTTTGPDQIRSGGRHEQRNWLTQEEKDQGERAQQKPGWQRADKAKRRYTTDESGHGEWHDARRRQAADSLGEEHPDKYRDFDGGGKLLDKLRNQISSPPGEDLQRMEDRNDDIRDVVDELHEKGYGAENLVASRGGSRSDPSMDVARLLATGATDYNIHQADGSFQGKGGPNWMDECFAGSGPDPKMWLGNSEDYVEEHERPHHQDLTDADGDIIKYTVDDEKPKQGPGRRAKAVRRQRHAVEGEVPISGWPGANVGPADFVQNMSMDLGAQPMMTTPEHVASYDPIEHFYKSGAADGIRSSRGSAAAGHFSDDAIASQAQGFLRTAGRHFSLAEQRELEEESHHLGARNLDGLDLTGTHYVE